MIENMWLPTCSSMGSHRWVTYMFTGNSGALASLQQVGGSVSLPPSEALHKQRQQPRVHSHGYQAGKGWPRWHRHGTGMVHISDGCGSGMCSSGLLLDR